MSKIFFIRKFKSNFLRFNLDKIFSPCINGFLLLSYLSKMARWRRKNRDHSFNDFYSNKFDYSKRYQLYQHISETEIQGQPVLYLEFGVAQGLSIKWWTEHHKNLQSKFFGFDTFEGLPEDWGGFKKGEMTNEGKFPEVNDSRCTFVKGLFQDSLPPLLKDFKTDHRKIIHLDADLYSSTLYVLTTLAPLMKANDILMFDEFSVPMHEFKALMDFESAYYIQYKVIGSMNNYFHTAIKLTKV